MVTALAFYNFYVQFIDIMFLQIINKYFLCKIRIFYTLKLTIVLVLQKECFLLKSFPVIRPSIMKLSSSDKLSKYSTLFVSQSCGSIEVKLLTRAHS